MISEEILKKELGKTGQEFLKKITDKIDKIIKDKGYISDMKYNNQIEDLSYYNAYRYINKKYSDKILDAVCEYDLYKSAVGEIAEIFHKLTRYYLNNKYNLIYKKSKIDDILEYKKYYYNEDLNFKSMDEFEKHFNINQNLEREKKERKKINERI